MTPAQIKILAVLGALVGAMAVATGAVFFVGDKSSARGRPLATSEAVAQAVTATGTPSASPSPIAATHTPTAPASPTTTPRQATGVRVHAASPVNVRSGPGTDFAIVGSLQPGAEARATGRTIDASWLVIELPAGAGWVSAGVVEVTGDPLSLSVSVPGPARAATPSSTATVTATAAPRTATPAATVTPGTVTAIATRTPAATAALPDLVLQSVSVATSGRVAVTIGNAGPGPLVARRVSVVGLDEAANVVFSDLTAPLTIAPGAAITVEFAYIPASPVTVTVILNADGSIAEANDTNNRRRVTLNPR